MASQSTAREFAADAPHRRLKGLPGRGEEALPKIPNYGHAARLSPIVLLSTLEEQAYGEYCKSERGGSSASTRKTRTPRTPSGTSGGRQRALALLYEKDRLFNTCTPDTSLKVGDSHILPESASASASATCSPGVSQEFQASQSMTLDSFGFGASVPSPVRSLGDFKPSTSLASTSLQAPVTSESPALRASHLRACFVHAESEIAAKLHVIATKAPPQAERRNALLKKLSRASTTIMHKSSRYTRFVRVDSSTCHDYEVNSDASEQESASENKIADLFEAFDKSPISKMAASEAASSQIKATKEERELACEVLNFNRWLCGLEPVTSDGDICRACHILNTAILPRAEVYMKAKSEQCDDAVEFAKVLGEVMSGGRCVLLHKDVSLTACIEQSLLCGNMANQNPIRSPGSTVLDPCDAAQIRSRAAGYREHQVHDTRKTGRPKDPALALIMASRERRAKERTELQELPSVLDGWRVFWTLTSKADAGAVPPATGQSQKTQGGRGPVSRHTQRRRGQSGRIRKVAWCNDRVRKELEKGRACSLFWGDREGAVNFRRYLLNPALDVFGLSRMQDTCVLWTGVKENAERSEHPSFVCFPPPGIVPYELLRGEVPTWTIMPDSRDFQPTHSLRIRMWRVRIAGDSAERLEPEVGIASITCDCSRKGNPFCILFRPAIQKISDGDQFEVELSGLRGCDTRQHFFHDFRSFRGGQMDHQLLIEAEKVCSLLDDAALWRPPKKTASEQTGLLLRSKSIFQADIPQINLVSHQSLSFTVDTPDVTIALWCPSAATLRALLVLVRSSGTEEIHRGTAVVRIRGQYLVRVKCPMAASRYTLSFRVAPLSSPTLLQAHPLKYQIYTSDMCPNLLTSPEHPLREKFGYAPQSPATHIHGITIIAPMEFRVLTGYVHFLVHIDPLMQAMWEESYKQRLQALTGPGVSPGKVSTLFCDSAVEGRGGSKQSVGPRPTVYGSSPQDEGDGVPGELPVGIVGALRKTLAQYLPSEAQDVAGAVHLDVTVLMEQEHRYWLKLQRRPDIPELYEGVLYLTDEDIDCLVELHLRFPFGFPDMGTQQNLMLAQTATQEPAVRPTQRLAPVDQPSSPAQAPSPTAAAPQQMASLKISEWIIIRKEEQFPEGF